MKKLTNTILEVFKIKKIEKRMLEEKSNNQ